MQRNLSNWASEYQTVYNAEAENELYNQNCGAVVPSKFCADGQPARVTIQNQLGVTSSDRMTAHWADNVRNLNRQAMSCSREYLSISPACTGRATACWISSLDIASYTNEECQPNAFATNDLLFIANPFDISALLQGNDELPPEVLLDATNFAGDRLGLNTTSSAVLAKSVNLGGAHSCSLMQDGTVQCWGRNTSGQLGINSDTDFVDTPQKVVGLTDVRQIAAARDHTCALTTQGLVYCWGKNTAGQLGDGTTTNKGQPTLVSGLSAVAQIAVGGGEDGHSCALLNTGQVRCWGYNTYSQVTGAGTTTNQLTPVVVSGLPNAKYIALGGWHSCAILANSVNSQCWGYSGDYQLGKTSTNNGGPYTMQSANFIQLAAGNRHTCGIDAQNKISCIGRNDSGQLGNGTSGSAQSKYNSPASATQISLGLDRTTCSVGTNGGIDTYCWGANGTGQLGDGTTTSRSTPTQVQGLAGRVLVISLGGYTDSTSGHTCAVLSTGSVQCWGHNSVGQLGIGSTTDSNAPRTVEFSP